VTRSVLLAFWTCVRSGAHDFSTKPTKSDAVIHYLDLLKGMDGSLSRAEEIKLAARLDVIWVGLSENERASMDPPGVCRRCGAKEDGKTIAEILAEKKRGS
jgi:hypothetical protein